MSSAALPAAKVFVDQGTEPSLIESMQIDMAELFSWHSVLHQVPCASISSTLQGRLQLHNFVTRNGNTVREVCLRFLYGETQNTACFH